MNVYVNLLLLIFFFFFYFTNYEAVISRITAYQGSFRNELNNRIEATHKNTLIRKKKKNIVKKGKEKDEGRGEKEGVFSNHCNHNNW